MPNAVIYTRCSTGDRDRSGLGLEAQARQAQGYADLYGFDVAAMESENGVSGRLAPDKRPVLGPVLDALDRGIYQTLIVATLDRLGRNAADILAVADRATRKGWDLVVLDLRLDTSTPVGKLAFSMLAAVAEFERNVIAERTRNALAELKAKGKRVGRPSEQSPEAVAMIRILKAEGKSLNAIAKILNAADVPTARKGRWYPSTVSAVLKSLAYSAELEANRGAAQ